MARIDMARIRGGALLAAAILASSSGCGGAGTFGDRAVQATLASAATLDGTVRGDLVAEPDALVSCGDTDATFSAISLRGFYSFNLSALPPGAVVTRAVLTAYQARVDGSPYPSLGTLMVDHVAYGTTLEGDAYSGSALALGVGTLSTSAALEYKSVDVTASVQNDVAARRARSQFRLRFSARATNDDRVTDAARFTDAEDTGGFGNPPMLVVTYRL